MHSKQADELVSVIVPIYKVEAYLHECVNSIIGQTYKNLEIILVDDGSPDNCGMICEEYAKADSRITVYHKENGGLSDARNYGIDRCHGEYITFVDSDDVIKSNYVERLLNLIIENDADAAVPALQKFSDAAIEGRDIDSIFPSGEINVRIFSGNDMMEAILYQRMFLGGACVLYKRKIYKDVRFPKGLYSEDVAVSYRVGILCNRVAVTNEYLYGYRYNTTSISHSGYSPKILTYLPASRQLYSDVCSGTPELKAAAASRAFSMIRTAYFTIPYSMKAERIQFWSDMKKYRKTILFDPKARKRERIMALATYLGANLFHVLFSRAYNKYIQNSYS